MNKPYNNKQHTKNKPVFVPNEQQERIIALIESEPGISQSKIIAIETKSFSADEKITRDAIATLRKERAVLQSHAFSFYPKKSSLVMGRVQTTDRGFAFLQVDGEDDSYFIPASSAKRLMQNDVVNVVLKPSKIEGERPTADVVRILESQAHTLWGTLHKDDRKEYWSVNVFGPSNTSADIRIPAKDFYKEGDTVSVQIPANRQDKPFLEIDKLSSYLGSNDKPFFVQDLVQKMYELPDFKKFPNFTVKKPAQNKKDYRHMSFVSIDDASTKDIDDAFYCEATNDGYKVFIAIADPTAFIESGSTLEQEALERGVTCYLPGKKISMLPKEISEELASLNEGKDTPSMVVINQYNNVGELQSSRIEQALIKNHAKLTYDEVTAYLAHGFDTSKPAIQSMLTIAYDLAKKIKVLHIAKGELPIERHEPDFSYDSTTGEIIDVTVRHNDESQLLVSTMMLEANIAVAHELQKNGWGIYRHHPEPTVSAWAKIKDQLSESINLLDWPETPSLTYLQGLFLNHKEHYDLLENTVFESLVAAHYSMTQTTHFSLGADAYTHFTSPIRRFADFTVHRLLKGEMVKSANLIDIVKSCNDKTLRASTAEKTAKKMLVTRFMLKNPEREWTAEFISSTKSHVKVFLKEAGIMAYLDRQPLEQYIEMIEENGKAKSHWKGPLAWQVCCTASLGVDKPLMSSVEHTLCSQLSPNI